MYYNPSNKNYLEAQYLIGLDYFQGNGVVQDYAKALVWFHKAASEGYAPAQDKIGFIYKNGYSVNQDQFKAFEWFYKSASQDYTEGQINLALMFKEGHGVDQDRSKSLEWFKKAAYKGNDIAKYNVELLSEENAVLTQNINDSKDIHNKNIEFNEPLLNQFRNFFNDYFLDESQRLPLNAGGGVWFPESMNEEDALKYIDKAVKAQEVSGLKIPFALGVFNIDTTTIQNLQGGIYVHLDEDNSEYAVFLKNQTDDWYAVTEFESACYDQSSKTFHINSYGIKITDQVACYYAERLADCINAYLSQNEEKIGEQTEELYSYVLTDVLDDIDGRINDIDEKIAMLLEDEEFFDEEQALLNSIILLADMISKMERNDVDDVQEIYYLVNDIEEKLVNISESGITLNDEQGICDLINGLEEKLKALQDSGLMLDDNDGVDELEVYLKSSDITEDLQLQLINDLGFNEQKAFLAANEGITLKVQNTLYELDDVEINEALAQNLSIHPELQFRFAHYCQNSEVRNFLAGNPSLTEECQIVLLEDDEVLSSLAENPNLTDILQGIFAYDGTGYGSYRDSLAKNTGINTVIQAYLMTADDEDVLRNLARNPSLIEELQLLLCAYEDKYLRYALIDNENLADSARALLVDDIENKRRYEKVYYANYTLFYEEFLHEFDSVTESQGATYFLENIIDLDIEKYMKVTDKLENLIQSLVNKDHYLETLDLILVMDTTIFGSLKEGLYIGKHAICYKAAFSDFHSVLLENIVSVDWNENKNYISINGGDTIPLAESYQRETARKLSKMFTRYQEGRDKIIAGL